MGATAVFVDQKPDAGRTLIGFTIKRNHGHADRLRTVKGRRAVTDHAIEKVRALLRDNHDARNLHGRFSVLTFDEVAALEVLIQRAIPTTDELALARRLLAMATECEDRRDTHFQCFNECEIEDLRQVARIVSDGVETKTAISGCNH
jgi:hypothetical protein